MTRPIRQSVTLNASPRELYETFLDSKKHAAVTGAPAKIDRKLGGRFTAFGGRLRGQTLLMEPERLIVQSWRSTHWKSGDPDSIVIVRFSKAAKGGIVNLVHVNVPAHDRKGVSQGWRTYYWKPWKAYLAERR